MSIVKVKKVVTPTDIQNSPTFPKKCNWLIVILSVLLVLSLGYIYYQNSQIAFLNQELQIKKDNLIEAQRNYTKQSGLAKQNDNLYREAKSNYINVKSKLEKFQTQYFIPIKEWHLYKDNVGLVTSPDGNCAYHLPSCHHLGDISWTCTIKQAQLNNCWPCSDCYDKDYYYGGPKDTYDNIIFKVYFGD